MFLVVSLSKSSKTDACRIKAALPQNFQQRAATTRKVNHPTAKISFRTQENTQTANSIQLLKWNLLLHYTEGVWFTDLILHVFSLQILCIQCLLTVSFALCFHYLISCFVDSLRYRTRNFRIIKIIND